MHAPEDCADGAEDVGGERDVFLGRHVVVDEGDDDEEKNEENLKKMLK